MKRAAILLVSCAMTLTALADDAVMNAEIDYVLSVVEQSDCVFIRNGKQHDAADAADHLRLKRRRGKRYFSSADEFIDRLASGSSWSGKPYTIQCPGEAAQPSYDWLSNVLAEYRRQQ